MIDTIPIIAATATDAAAANTIAGQFGLDWGFFIAQCINFIIVAFVLWRFVFKPVISSLEHRKQTISDGLQFAEEMKERLAEAEKQAAEKIKEASGEAAKMVAKARESASAFLEKQNQEAIKKAQRIIEKSHEAMTQERKQLLTDVRKEVASLVVLTSSKVLDRELSVAEKTRFSETASKEIYANNLN